MKSRNSCSISLSGDTKSILTSNSGKFRVTFLNNRWWNRKPSVRTLMSFLIFRPNRNRSWLMSATKWTLKKCKPRSSLLRYIFHREYAWLRNSLSKDDQFAIKEDAKNGLLQNRRVILYFKKDLNNLSWKFYIFT